MMKLRSKLPLLVTLVLAWGIAPSPAHPMDDEELKFMTPRDDNLPLVFNYKGKETSDPKTIPIVANSLFSEEVAKVSPVSQKIGGTARIVMDAAPLHEFTTVIKDRFGISRGAEAQRFLDAYFKVADNMFAEAVKRAKVFDSVTVEKGNAVPTSSNGSDFILWRENSQWFIRNKNGPRNFVYTSPKGLPGRMEMLPQAAGDSRNAANSSALSSARVGRKTYYHFAGKEVASADEAIGIINSYNDDSVKDVKSSPIQLKGRLLIARASKSTPNFSRAMPNPDQERVSNAMFAAADRARIEAIIKSGLFEEIVVKTIDTEGPPPQGFDVEIWQSPSKPMTWNCKAGSSPPFNIEMGGELNQMVERLGKSIAATGYPERAAQ